MKYIGILSIILEVLIFLPGVTFAQPSQQPPSDVTPSQDSLNLDESFAVVPEGGVAVDPDPDPDPEAEEGYPSEPSDPPCIPLNTFALDVQPAPGTLDTWVSAALEKRFAFAYDWFDHMGHLCVDAQGVELAIDALTKLVEDRGYVTTRIEIDRQSLDTDTPRLLLIPGVIRQLRYTDATRGTWKSAFPVRNGDILNTNDLRQGAAQITRVPSEDASVEIEPVVNSGESDVLVAVQKGKPWRVTASVDNLGQRASGKLEGGLSVGIDNPLGLSDIFNISTSHDLEFGDRSLGTSSFSGSWSVPWGYWTATAYGGTSTSAQSIAGAYQPVVFRQNEQSIGAKLERVLNRSQNDVLGVELQLIRRRCDCADGVQSRTDNTFAEAGLTDQHVFGVTNFAGTLAYRQAIGGPGTLSNLHDGHAEYPLHVATLDANLSVPFSAVGEKFRYVSTLHGQLTNDSPFYIDRISIAGFDTVRGFDGNTTLAASSGFYWRNELQETIGKPGSVVYIGLDYGHLFGLGAESLPGTQIVGAAIGLRGSVLSNMGTYSYHLFVGTPVYKPAGFDTARLTLGFQLTGQY
ncbi:ShlB/FhaC/HecB family hemolysin secretion/activation protein [Paraburkholderia heleia]|uniref:ShlB/FhaC/HecB family hemolysin secretion/activation protein n=1 Tax=Paraburkholderia heleia TaxID=634127 RepID=UPI002AB668AF|nr:ShlB/FhaC/HecB family hemolysin secretion/activation protein [Paraburkholderia heleia]